MDVILFGAGKNLIDYWDVFFNKNCKVIDVVDNFKIDEKLPNGMKVKNPNIIKECKYDAIYITLVRQKQILEVLEQLQNMSVCADNICYLSNGKFRHLPNVHMNFGREKDKTYFFFEVTSMTRLDYGTGIQRTVKNFYLEAKKLYGEVVPIQFFGGFITSYEYEYQYEIRKGKYDGREYIADFRAGDYVFFSDTSWSIGIDDCDYDYIHNRGAKLCFVIYDLTPIRKEKFVTELHFDLFTEWINKIFTHADSVVCISKAVADDLEKYYKELNIRRMKKLPLYVNYLGCDIPEFQGKVRSEIEKFVTRSKTFLMVGTVQPLKNHIIAIDALKIVYENLYDDNIQLLIIGKPNDLMPDFEEIIKSNGMLQRNVLWIKDAEDEELIWAYDNCSALLFPSQAEGFGLPLVEAAYFNLPILCSDIPVFREIAGENATYFKVNDAVDLAESIIKWLRDDTPIPSREIERYTWKESAEGILEILEEKAKPYKILF